MPHSSTLKVEVVLMLTEAEADKSHTKRIHVELCGRCYSTFCKRMRAMAEWLRTIPGDAAPLSGIRSLADAHEFIIKYSHLTPRGVLNPAFPLKTARGGKPWSHVDAPASPREGNRLERPFELF